MIDSWTEISQENIPAGHFRAVAAEYKADISTGNRVGGGGGDKLQLLHNFFFFLVF